ncbi:Cof-type HAD-IIB family hydrolase [Chondrinema litorale]|uniref:Cof-type HAD-IIB family hydrolase n=1 Tax=Chondrinema litorale TaxID=2994555 RepID=UPI002542C3DA|nr:Cof-type HAD-IIB family hydrolase [Chondrinema litorale]UZR98357.1 Cof-type HAD-IIB family hydrolase [Chondrinema litorale]
MNTKDAMEKYNTICLDLDGTILALKSDITPFCATVLKKLSTQLDIILVSARIPSGMSYIQEKVGTSSKPIICYNGAYIVKGEEVIYDKCIPVSLIEGLLKPCNELNVNMGIYSYNDWSVPEDSARIQKEIHNTKTDPVFEETATTIANLKKKGKGAHKIMLMGVKDSLDQLGKLLSTDLKDKLVAYRSNDTIIEIAPNDVSKLDGIKALLGEEALTKVIAFGDNYNDIDMLREVGMGIAVANARDEVKAVADEHTLSCAEDGVPIFLNKYFELGIEK